MGFFGRFAYSDGQWRDDAHESDEQFLVLDIHDSDIATIDFRSATAEGRFHLGFQPRDYFEDPSASEPVDNDAQAMLFATWAREALGVEVTAARVREMLAEPDVEEPVDDFVEETASRLLELLALPLPEELRELDPD